MAPRPPDKDFRRIYESLYSDEDGRDEPIFRKHERIARDIAARFSRGNVSIQNSVIIDRDFVKCVQSEMIGNGQKTLIRRTVDRFKRSR